MLYGTSAPMDVFARRDFLKAALITGSSTAAVSGIAASGFNAFAQQQEEPCDVIDKLRFVASESPHADVLSRALDFMCPDPPPHPNADLVAERWETARLLYIDALHLVNPYPLVIPQRVDILSQRIKLEFSPLPTYPQFLELEAELCSTLGACENPVVKIILKILGAIGLKFDQQQMQALLATIGESIGGLLDALVNALKGQAFKQAWKAFWAILEALVSAGFRQALARTLGRAAATRFFAALGAKLIPWIGWGIFIAALLYSFAEQIF